MPKYLVRLILLFIVGVAVLFWVRGLLVPKSFGRLGHYRADAIGEIAAQTPTYAGHKACGDCHPDVVEIKSKNKHAGLSCEICHGPAQAHADDPGSMKPNTDLDRSFCLRCHQQDISRPSGFPQVDGSTHGEKEDCRKCHQPHHPGLN